MPPETQPESRLTSEVLALVGLNPGTILTSDKAEAAFSRATKKQLLDCAQRLGMTGISKLSKEQLAARIQSALAGLELPSAAPVDAAEPVTTPDVSRAGSFAPKFDLGRTEETESIPQNIPWGYGLNRVTAMVVDPDRMFVYWEVTDDAVATARAGLGGAGANAWLNLRVYDISGRLFDGTNAHGYFDHRLERHDRQWFFTIGKPTSNACVEIGLMSSEGYFVKIARSGRVDFPRREPVGGGSVEWLSVRNGAVNPSWAAGGAGGGAAAQGGGPGGGDAAAGGGAPGAGAPGGWQGDWQDWTTFAGFPAPGGQRIVGRRWDWQEHTGAQWTSELSKTEWVGPVLRTEWEAGPFSYPVEMPGPVEYHQAGEISVRTEGGRVHVVYGPWQVVIRGLGARAERRVLGTWEYRKQIAVNGGVERTEVGTGRFAPGSSEWMAVGASERSWLGASELLWRGASELWLLGASEIMLGGASEQLYMGATELRFRGASERLMAGASERLLRGASERLLGGASEQLYAGASERMGGGASELLYGGASEQRYAGASERLASRPAGDATPPGDALPYPNPERKG
jgi:hypothetical protein